MRFRNKVAAIDLLGGACACCKESAVHFLNIDHIESNGKVDRKNGIDSTIIHKLIKNHQYKNIDTLRVLCYNCNLAFATYGFCPHEFNIEAFEECNVCNSQLIASSAYLGCNKPTNYHDLFKKSNIPICLNCIWAQKHNAVLTANKRMDFRKRLNLRAKILDNYGGKCQCCDENKYVFLTLDHINFHDGLFDYHLYRYLLKNNCPSDNYRLLCWNCNCSRGHNGSDGICQHLKPPPPV